MEKQELVADIPENIWSAIVSLMDFPLWNKLMSDPSWHPESRTEVFHCYCQWWFKTHGDLT